MKLGRWKLFAERGGGKVHFGDEGFGFGNRSALAEQPGENLELGDVVAAFGDFMEDGVANEVEASDAKTFFVDGVVEKGKISTVGVGGDVGDANDGVMSV